ncbi:AEC family transporter [Clostridium sp. D2Q-14]|uniref:AEC family transporter n=1 Tax=Anaeromonas gelatinilytica TaxID=2683194 RepID=UPI00193C4A84|nr:AEC family transporter [Anaeromonas gelatinilytica]MBS4535069.1 AEC family transporter [Anaeromonas gelatinilytica]
MNIFFYILINNIMPIFFLITIGFILNKKFNFDIYTLSKLNFYVFVPSFLLVKLYTTDLEIGMVKVFLFAILLITINYLIGILIPNILGFEKSLGNAFINSISFINSGNIGIPLITLIFSNNAFIVNGVNPYLDIALSTQIIIYITQNIFTNTIGFYNASRGSTDWKNSLKSVFKIPVIYMIPLAIILKFLPYDITKNPIWSGLVYAKEGMISFALIVLGVQLSKTKITFRNNTVYLSNFVRLLGGPIIAFVLIKLLNIDSIIAQTLMVSSGLPTAVNTALISVEHNNEPEFASQVVMTSTIFSAITLSIVVYIAGILFPL